MAQSTIINGQGRFAGGPTTPLAVIRILQRYYTISLPLGVHHALRECPNVTSIKFDVVSRHLPLLVDSIEVPSDQRYSFLLNATNRSQAQIIGFMLIDPNVGFDAGLNSAILGCTHH